jgi:hypothetical protein
MSPVVTLRARHIARKALPDEFTLDPVEGGMAVLCRRRFGNSLGKPEASLEGNFDNLGPMLELRLRRVTSSCRTAVGSITPSLLALIIERFLSAAWRMERRVSFLLASFRAAKAPRAGFDSTLWVFA